MRKLLLNTLLLFFLINAHYDIYGQIITTVAGGGSSLLDGVPATSESIGVIVGLAVDLAGNLYIADNSHNKVQKVSPFTGIITTIAGTGAVGFSGDGGAASSAVMSSPVWVTIDNHGNLYITTLNRIRKIDAITGIITTVAGNGAIAYNGDGIPATTAAIGPQKAITDRYGNLYISDNVNRRIRKVDTNGIISTIAGTGTIGYSGDGGPATAAEIKSCSGICIDTSDNLYFADFINQRIRMIDQGTGIISTIAGNGIGTYNGDGIPATMAQLDSYDITLDNAGNIYIADANNARIRMINAATGIISTVAGSGTPGFSGDGGMATLAEMDGPEGVALDDCGNIYIADDLNHRARKVAYPLTTITLTDTLTASPADTVCAGTPTTFTASATASSGGVAYQWYVNGSLITASGSAYTYTPANGDSIRCVATATNPCSNATTSSNTITMVVNTIITPTVTITSMGDTVCSGTAVTFTVSATSPELSYQWLMNGSAVTGATSTTYNYVPANGDSIRCIAAASSPCTPATTSSNSITMVVNPIITPTVTVTSTGDTVCSGTAVTFTVTATSPELSYQWLMNGSAVTGATSTTYNYVPANGDSIRCIASATGPCAPATTKSNSITMVVNPIITPTVTVTSTADTVCSGTEVTFTVNAIPLTIGTSYQWLVNGSAITGATSATYNYVPVNADSIRCIAMATTPCSAVTTSSNSITIVVNPIITPTVTVTSTADTVCSGTEVTFTVNATSPELSYQWLMNGSAVTGATSATYNFIPANGDSIRCIAAASSPCTPATTSSNSMFMVVNPIITPTVTVTSTGDTVCGGSEVTFTAIVTGGVPLAYQWLVNGSPMSGATASAYTYTPTNADSVRCIATAANPCVTDTASSNTITMSVDPVFIPIVTITSGNDISYGQNDTLRATVAGTGSSPSFQWILNSTVLAGETNDILIRSDFVNGDSVSCVVAFGGLCGLSSFNSVLIALNSTGITTSMQGANDIQLYPNPTTYELTIKMTQNTYVSFTVSNTLGQQLMQQPLTSTESKVNVGILPSGLYYITFKGSNGPEVRKFVKM